MALGRCHGVSSSAPGSYRGNSLHVNYYRLPLPANASRIPEFRLQRRLIFPMIRPLPVTHCMLQVVRCGVLLETSCLLHRLAFCDASFCSWPMGGWERQLVGKAVNKALAVGQASMYLQSTCLSVFLDFLHDCGSALKLRSP